MAEMENTDVARQQSEPTSSLFSVNLSELFYRTWDHWKLLLILALIGTGLGYLYTSHNQFVPIYQAKATIYVVSKDSIVSDLSLGTTLAGDYVKIFSMWEMQERVISKLGLPYSYTELGSMVSVSTLSNTHMIEIAVQSTDPNEAAQIANAYATVGSDYIAETMSVDKPNLMSAALVPTNPINREKKYSMVIGAALGIVLGIGIVYIIILMDDKVKTSDDIRTLTGLVTLSIIPKIDNTAEPEQRRHHRSQNIDSGKEKAK